ncbi:hypothetical protein F2Q70_00002504 [Brassica cretica]|uniref:Uncharacterized protein n=1 Tax=Brassica cretica TaxID=69181 RepID=A0A8S9IR15_BRACR|nr:hypothetical protein F2Q70_00002504 [Brassica cretica]
MSSNVKLDGKDKPQYGQIGHLAMVPAKAPFRTYAGLSSTLHGQSVRYGEKHEPRLKCSERSDLQAGSAPCKVSKYRMIGEINPRAQLVHVVVGRVVNVVNPRVDVYYLPFILLLCQTFRFCRNLGCMWLDVDRCCFVGVDRC